MYNNSVNNVFLNQKVVQITTNYTAQVDDVIIEVSALSAPITITLPTPSSKNVGKFFLIKDTSGEASTRKISITYPSNDDVYILARNYGSMQLFSDGSGYFSYSGEIPFACGIWKKNSVKAFDAGTTKTNSLVTDWATTPAPLTARLDLSALTRVSLISLIVANDAQSITFTQTGLYSIALNSSVVANTYGLLQLMRNAGTVLNAYLNYPIQAASVKPLQIFYLANFAEGDTLDFRYGVYKGSKSYQFLNITLLIQQLPINE